MIAEVNDTVLTITNGTKEEAEIINAALTEFVRPVVGFNTLLVKTFLQQEILANHPDCEQFIERAETQVQNCQMVLMHESDLAWWLHTQTYSLYNDLPASLFWGDIYLAILKSHYNKLI